MTLIAWQPQFNVNVEIIDKQHQLLVKMINDLYAAMARKDSMDILKKLIRQLSTYAAMHFAREEHYFDLLNYPNAESHKKEHEDFELKITQFEDDFNAGIRGLSIEIIRFLSDWLVEHIKGSDKKYGPFLNRQGIK